MGRWCFNIILSFFLNFHEGLLMEVMTLLTLGQGRSGHVWVKGLVVTPWKCRVSSHGEEGKMEVVWALVFQCFLMFFRERKRV